MPPPTAASSTAAAYRRSSSRPMPGRAQQQVRLLGRARDQAGRRAGRCGAGLAQRAAAPGRAPRRSRSPKAAVTRSSTCWWSTRPGGGDDDRGHGVAAAGTSRRRRRGSGPRSTRRCRAPSGRAGCRRTGSRRTGRAPRPPGSSSRMAISSRITVRSDSTSAGGDGASSTTSQTSVDRQLQVARRARSRSSRCTRAR